MENIATDIKLEVHDSSNEDADKSMINSSKFNVESPDIETGKSVPR